MTNLLAFLCLTNLVIPQAAGDTSFVEVRVEVASDQSSGEQSAAAVESRPRFENEPLVDLRDLDRASVQHQQVPARLDPDSSFFVVLRLRPEGLVTVAGKTQELIGRRLGVFVGGELNLVFTIKTEIYLIPASPPRLSEEEAETLAREINLRIQRLREGSQ